MIARRASSTNKLANASLHLARTHDHALAAVDEGVNQVAADITSAAGDQDCHGLARARFPILLSRALNNTKARRVGNAPAS
jgi:hypothetical protein